MNTVFPIAYFGNINYFRELANANSPVIEVKEHFIKQTLRTRCEIMSANGILQLNIPVSRKFGSKTPMDEVMISYDTDWRKIHWKAIESAYSSSPFFEYYGMEVEELIYQEESNLVQFNLNITDRILDWLSIQKQNSISYEYQEVSDDIDFRKNDFQNGEPIKKYNQVFSDKYPFTPNLSILDLIFCEGPLTRNWIIPSS